LVCVVAKQGALAGQEVVATISAIADKVKVSFTARFGLAYNRLSVVSCFEDSVARTCIDLV
jgi:hypothetical protein